MANDLCITLQDIEQIMTAALPSLGPAGARYAVRLDANLPVCWLYVDGKECGRMERRPTEDGGHCTGIVPSDEHLPELARYWDVVRGLLEGKQMARLWSVVNEAGALPAVTNPVDRCILGIVTTDPDLTDQAIGQQLGFTRQAINARRKTLEKMGYTVR